MGKVMQIFRSSASRFAIVVGAGLLASTSSGSAQSNQTSYATFVSAVSALASSADDLMTNQRNAARQIYIRQQVTESVLAAFPSSDTTAPAPKAAPPGADGPKPLNLAIDATTLLCNFRSQSRTVVSSISSRDPKASITLDQLAAGAEQTYLNAAVGDLTSAATPANTSDIVSAFKVLFSPPPAVNLKTNKNLAVDDNTRKYVEANCEKDLNEFAEAYYGKAIPVVLPPPAPAPVAPSADKAAPPPAIVIPDLSFLGPIGVAINTAIGIITPVIESFAALKAGTAAETNVKDILTNDQKPLVDGGLALARTQSDYMFAKRMSLAGQFAEQLALVQADSIDLNSEGVQLACPRPYSAMYMRDAHGNLSATFMHCYSTIWTHFEKGVDAALQTAVAYDQLADKGDTSTALDNYDKMTRNYSDIIKNEVASDAKFWQQASQLIAFAGAVATATSSSNVKKLEQALQAAGK
jgi:hypothetical protein